MNLIQKLKLKRAARELKRLEKIPWIFRSKDAFQARTVRGWWVEKTLRAVRWKTLQEKARGLQYHRDVQRIVLLHENGGHIAVAVLLKPAYSYRFGPHIFFSKLWRVLSYYTRFLLSKWRTS